MASSGISMLPVKHQQFKDKQKPDDVRISNIAAAKAVSDSIRTSLGPKGMDKMIQTGRNGENVIVSNDGATILKHISVLHPASKMLVDLSGAQDIEAGDGTTSVVIIAGSLLSAAEKLMSKGLHPTIISQSFQKAARKAVEILKGMSKEVSLNDRDVLNRIASTSLSSKIVSQHSSLLAPIAVEAVMIAKESGPVNNVDLNNIRLIKKVGGTIEDTHLVQGLVLNQEIVKSAGGPVFMEKAKIALIQFHLSPPKPDIENQIVVNDCEQIDKILKEEREYLLNICKKIKKTGCNVLLVQKSILRDAVTEVSLSFLKKLKILVVKDVEREEVEFICNSIGTKPIADIESFTEDKLISADLVEETLSAGEKVVKITGAKYNKKCVCILMHGSSSLVLEEAGRSLHDALCSVRCIVKNNAIIAGCGAPEIEISQKLRVYARSLSGMETYCFQAFADAIEMIPTTLIENSGLSTIDIISQLKHLHSIGKINAGIDVKTGKVVEDSSEYVIQPLLVSTSAIELAAETVKMILKIDDM